MDKPSDFYGRKDTFISPDNIDASRERYEAGLALENGNATPAQRKLLSDCDRDMQRLLKEA